MSTSSKPILESDFTDMTLFMRVEGGAIYTQEKDSKFLVVTDESAIADLLEPEDLDGIELVKVIEFDTKQARSDYLTSRFEKPAPLT
ncbi:hypothetical protein VT06_15465 [Arsukibacterium sp. MJ3]|uniref:hypothetical protein n=1 Tax=Arsukibacterium sp. MJ3 TaxID=1632859 RepID=UPI0006271458|nr:hypothetical protein [Arsukibacterium sp. MJ3]KKO47713.1 hypothetical protein VT06_15465 [Arsukibacterium sp. MJ3]